MDEPTSNLDSLNEGIILNADRECPLYCARNYVDSDMVTNQQEGDWLPMRCLILPAIETIFLR